MEMKATDSYVDMLTEHVLFEGQTAPKTIEGYDLMIYMAETADQCVETEYMDYEIETYPPVKMATKKDIDTDEWKPVDFIIGIQEDHVPFNELTAAWILQELGIIENTVDVLGRREPLDDFSFEGVEGELVIPSFDESRGSIIAWATD